MKSSPFLISAAGWLALQLVDANAIAPSSPSVSIKNGTVQGVHDYVWDQDYFLSIPYARPPVGSLRFRPPQYINHKLGNINAKQYKYHCFGYGEDQVGYQQSEDCLTLNVVRPAGIHPNAKLPVAVWIHGGGFYEGGANDKRYNLTFMVDQSVKIGKPIIGVSMNYRLDGWGFLASREVAGTENLNVGLKDQRLAMHWVKDNIDSFGGDSKKVTIFGESAGGASVGFQQIAFNGRNDGLFRGVIAQSGGPVFYGADTFPADYQAAYDTVINATGCTDAADSLECLRGKPVELLNATLSTVLFGPVFDGDFVADFGSQAIKNGKYVKVPTIIGTTSDEGASFGQIGANTTEDIAVYLAATTKFKPAMIQRLLELYPENESVPPANNFTGPDAHDATVNGTALYGAQYHRAAAIIGDYFFIANRRYVAEQLAAQGVPVWSYRFRARAQGYQTWYRAGHFTEVAFVFHNLNGDGYNGPYDHGNPLGGDNASYYVQLSDFMCHSWVRFIATGDPRTGTGPHDVKWLQYHEGSGKSSMVFDVERDGDDFIGGSYIEKDDFRAAGIAYMNKYALQAGRTNWVHDKFDDGNSHRPRDNRDNRDNTRDNRDNSNREGQRSSKIRVENLHYDLGESDIRDVFSRVGDIRRVDIVYDKAGRSEGIAHVIYSSPDEAMLAVDQFDGANAKGQPIRVKIASFQQGGGRRGGGGGPPNEGRSLFERVSGGPQGPEVDESGRPLPRRDNQAVQSRNVQEMRQNARELGIDRYIPGERNGSRDRRGPPRRGGMGGERERHRGDRGGRGGRGGGGRGGRNNEGEEKTGGTNRPRKTAEELDAEMNDYWGAAGDSTVTSAFAPGGDGVAGAPLREQNGGGFGAQVAAAAQSSAIDVDEDL
ncbi:hypothetical protein H072_8517 [Dactylellina haptotyla CBS 200.50]|uniref:RRM domain-containing protein n=1 Tax=Dactylellina haptotyla (strain CBS 200.50) TaxID=1284197 RepID=S8AA09_DACHA|nr:hypothetical protein H072_8517 [Dactylellina haptotyla CBS 200.50]